MHTLSVHTSRPMCKRSKDIHVKIVLKWHSTSDSQKHDTKFRWAWEWKPAILQLEQLRLEVKEQRERKGDSIGGREERKGGEMTQPLELISELESWSQRTALPNKNKQRPTQWPNNSQTKTSCVEEEEASSELVLFLQGLVLCFPKGRKSSSWSLVCLGWYLWVWLGTRNFNP